MTTELTDEQKQIIDHADGRHAVVLAVAGSGKTTTMAYRIKHLADNLGVQPHEIRVLMFNRQAREDFERKLQELNLDDYTRQVQTFHSIGFRVIGGRQFQQWYAEFEERAQLCLRRIVSDVQLARRLGEDEISVAEAKRAIGLWKGALIAPSHAGYGGRFSDVYVDIYKRFEDVRIKANAITFDDFVPLAVRQLQNDSRKRDSLVKGLRYIIVDEYQDVNYGQQFLLEILASGGADVMVVGDDDQTIYEWRGARSDYIRREFPNAFPNKPHSLYKLTNSFRFGFLLSQSSNNVIMHNMDRQTKDLLTHNPEDDSEIQVLAYENEGGESPNRALTDEIEILVKEKRVEPQQIRVLGRTYSQLNGLQTEMLIRKIPFKVLEHSTFLDSGEVRTLLGYIRVAASLRQPPVKSTKDEVVTIANRPNRKLPRRALERMCDHGTLHGISLGELLTDALETGKWFVSEPQFDELKDFAEILEALFKRLDPEEDSGQDELAGPLLEWLDNTVGLQDHYRDFYGEGEDSQNRINNIISLIYYAHAVKLGWRDFLTHVRDQDTTLGLPDNEVILMSSIHLLKGLEFDYVFIPDCLEGFMPTFGSNDDPTFDTGQPRRTPRPAEWIENERRLFYVGATRARKALYIGTKKLLTESARTQDGESTQGNRKDELAPSLASRFLEEMELEPTREVASEVVKAARKQPNNLAEVLQRRSPFHAIVKGVKNLGRFFSQGDRRKVAAIEPDSAERPFAYKQTYDSPARRRINEEGKGDELWGHISLRRPREESKAPRRTVLPPKRTI